MTPDTICGRPIVTNEQILVQKKTLQQKEYHQLYIFGQRVIEFDIEESAKQFQSSSVVIADILTIVFTFTSA
jgi:hypothetical protein